MSSTYAGIEDVESALGRALADAELGPTEHLLRLAHALVRTEAPRLDERVAGGTLDDAVVRAVLVAAVLRVVRNPDSARGVSRTAGPFTDYRQFDTGSVGLRLLEVEQRLLAVPRTRATGLGTVRISAGFG